jgi:hypothetical protein
LGGLGAFAKHKQLKTTTGGLSDEYDLETARKAW